MRALPVALVLLAPGLLAEERSVADPRAELAFLEQALSQAADRVARPSVFAITGAECRGYRIEGQGAIFVLPPRAVRSRSVVVWRLPEARAPRAPRDRDRQIRVIELQAEELQREAARTHAELERAIAEVEREVERRLATQPRASGAAVPAAPAAPPPAAAPLPPVAPEAPAAPLPPSPPWALWFEAGGPEEEAPAEAVVGRMRSALVEALAEHGLKLRGLRPDESIAVAVDFVPSVPFGASRPERTLVLRVRKRDLDERRAGKLGADQLKTRIEAAEY